MGVLKMSEQEALLTAIGRADTMACSLDVRKPQRGLLSESCLMIYSKDANTRGRPLERRWRRARSKVSAVPMVVLETAKSE